MPAATLTTTRRLALAGMFAGLAWASGYVESIPNFELLTVIVFVGGWVLGPKWGAIPGALGEFLFSAINPYGLAHPLVVASQVIGMALSGVAGGLLGRAGKKHPVVLVLAGIVVTLVFDILTNVASGIAYGQMATTLKLAIPFALAHVGTNAALFGTVGVLLVNALERTRRSLLAALIFIALGAGVADAQTAVTPAPTPVAAPTPADSLAKPLRTPTEMTASPEDSIAYRDATRAQPPALWGLGPSHLLRRDDGTLASALMKEGGFSERFADDRGSAEPLGRFGLAGANRVLVDWLGLPLTGVGARGGETLRAPWNAVASMDGPRLPVSSTEPYRGELGAVTLAPFGAVHRHPRVEGWASLGDPSMTENGFSATGNTHRWDGFITVDAASLTPLEPAGPEGHHSLATRLAFADGYWTIRGTYRVSRQSLEDLEPRYENRDGEGGALDVVRQLPDGMHASLRLERTAETVADATEALGPTLQRGKGGRGTLRVDGAHDTFAAFTYGQETLESEGTVPFDRRRANLWWGTAGTTRELGTAWTAKASLGAGAYGGGGVDIAPSLLVESDPAHATAWWGGVARGLIAALDSRLTDADGDTVRGDPPIARSSTWLAGVGLVKRAGWDRTGGSWRDPAPRGAMTLRTAVWAGRATPSTDPARALLAGGEIEQPSFVDPGATKFIAWTGNVRFSPLAGLTVDGGAHAIGREVPGFVTPFDPELRGYGTVEGRHRFGADGPDARVAATMEWIGPRDGPGLPAATRLGLNGGLILDEFEIHARWENLAGSNRVLPTGDPAAESRFRVEVRWTFWD